MPCAFHEIALIEVVRPDTDAHQIVVTDQKTKADEKFQWNNQTKFTEHHKSVNAGSLQAGMRIHLTYEPSSGTPRLKAVKISPAKPEAHSSASNRSVGKT